MPQSHQILGHLFVLDTNEKCGHGDCGSHCSSQVWHVVFKILDKYTWGNFVDGPNICYHSYVWGGA